MNPQLTPDEIQYIADLPNHAGWALFRDLIQATHDNLLNALAAADTSEKQQRLFNDWKAYRTLLANTQNMESWAQQMLQDLMAAQQFVNNQQQQQGVFTTPETRMSAEEHGQIMAKLRAHSTQNPPPVAAQQLQPLR
jgi:hypothetical protein